MRPFWDDDVRHWVDDRLPHAGPFPDCRAMGVEHKGETVAGFCFHNWDAGAGLIEVSGAAIHPRWATRAVVTTAMEYIFEQVGCQMMYARQHIRNLPARKGWLKLGATETVVPRLFGRGTTGTILWLTDDAWRSSKFYRSK